MVPTYRCKQDSKAISILESCFKDRPVIGLDSVEIIWGLGSWHCLSQQEPYCPPPAPPAGITLLLLTPYFSLLSISFVGFLLIGGC